MRRNSAIIIAIAALAVPAVAHGQQPVAEKASGMSEVIAKSLTWMPAKIPGFVPGMEMAVVQGNPEKEGPYTMRLRFPSGYAFPAHWHPRDENLTVLSGTFLLGMGDKTNTAALKKYAAGDYLFMPATMPHFGRAEGETVIQLHGMGPFDITVIEKIAGAAQ